MKENTKKFEISFDYEGNMKITIDQVTKEHILSSYIQLLNEISLAADYFNNDKISPEEKEMYISVYLKMMQNLSFLYNLLLMSGMTSREITEAAISPF